MAAKSALAETAYAAIKDLILHQRLRPGEVTSVNRLADALQIGRSPVAQAVTRLETEGLLEVHRRRGTRVKRLSSTEARELFEARRTIERFAAYAAADRIFEADLAKLRELLERLREESIDHPAAERSMGSFIDADVEFHNVLVDMAGNRYLSRAYRSLNLHLLISTYLHRHDTVMASVRHAEHVSIVEALSRGDGAGVAQALEEHVRQVESVVVQALEEEERVGQRYRNGTEYDVPEDATDEAGLSL